MSVNMPMATSMATRKRPGGNVDKEALLKSKLTTFYTSAIKEEKNLKKYFDTTRARFLGAGAFGHVFSLRALRDLTFSDLEALTKAGMKDETHKTHNKIVSMRINNPSEVVLRRQAEVAMKCENAFAIQPEDLPLNPNSPPKIDPSRFSVYKEYNALCQIFNRYGYSAVRGFTKPYAFGRLGEYHEIDTSDKAKPKMFGFHFLLFEMCGPDMEELMNACSYDCKQMDQKLSARTVMMIGDQLFARLQSIQEPQLAFSHNDLKNDQLMIGRYANANTIYLIDYGLVTNYMEHLGKEHLPEIGNRRWTSRSNHLEKPRTPLCELESACYVLLRLLRNHFPWDGLYNKQLEKYNIAKNKGENTEDVKSGNQLVYEVKQALWMHLRVNDGVRPNSVRDVNNREIDFKNFFEERDDKWGDGASQIMEVMLEMGKISGHKEFHFWENPVTYENLGYMDLRKHMLSMFDLSMYSHNLESSGLPDGQRMKLEKFFADNKASNDTRTECGRPVYFYFPEGEQICYWEWYCRAINMYEEKPEYWHKLLANRMKLLEKFKIKKKMLDVKHKR